MVLKIPNKKRFLFKHNKGEEKGFAFGFDCLEHMFCFWLGYGKPVWWKPRVIGRDNARYGFGFGWLLLCFRVQVFRHLVY